MAWRNQDEQLLAPDDVAELLRKEMTKLDMTASAYAVHLNNVSGETNFSATYVYDILKCRRAPGKTVLKELGLSKQITYKRWR